MKVVTVQRVEGRPRTRGDRLRKARVMRGLSLRALERKTGLSNAFLSQAERDLSEISLGTAMKLSAALEITLDYIAYGRGGTP